MAANMIFFAWNRSLPGREKSSAAHFQDFVQYLGGLKSRGAIQSFDIVLLDNHGGDLNGFFLIRAEPSKLDALMATQDWDSHMLRASLHLEGSGAVRGTTGDPVMERMKLWTSLIPA